MKFRKMHGLGNDFVIMDARERGVEFSANEIAIIADRHFGVGFDQLATIEAEDGVDAHIRFWNQDGSPSGACGNATRCVAEILMSEAGDRELRLRTERGVLLAKREADGLINVNMGQPVLNWQEIPLAKNVDIDALPLDGAPMAVGMGNPHCVFFVEDAQAVDLERLGPIYEHDPLFPERTNVEFLSSLGDDHLRMRVWERGGMITLACGSGACAAVVAAHRRGVVSKDVRVSLDGGDLWISWREDGVWMKGETALVFEGVLSDALLDG